MLNLAIECSGVTASVALAQCGEVLMDAPLPQNLGTVQALAVTIDELVNTRLAERPQLISVTTGPGSFTGLRVGLATAKMLAYAWDTPVVAVDSLEAIALRLVQPEFLLQPDASTKIGIRHILPVINAFRRQLFASAWEFTPPNQWRSLACPQVVNAAAWQADPWHALSGRDHPPASATKPATEANADTWLLTGPGLRAYSPTHPIVRKFELAPENLWDPTAVQVAQIGWRNFQSGRATNAEHLLPNYIRGSAAEEAKPV
jgi:tRNA threonylcarbamoyl adenosine modification protein YeaZ